MKLPINATMIEREHSYAKLLIAVHEGKPLQQYDTYNGEWYDVEYTLGKLFREMSRKYTTTGEWGNWRIKPQIEVYHND